METRNLTDLYEYPLNQKVRTISPEAYADLLTNIEMGQHSTLLIMPDGEVIGGNHRLRAMREKGFATAKCIILSFENDPEMGYFALLDGEKILIPGTEVVPRYYKTIDEGKAAYSLSNNTIGARYVEGALSTLQTEYPDLDMNAYRVPSIEIPRFEESMQELIGTQAPEKTEQEKKPIDDIQHVTCPNCNQNFEVNLALLKNV